MQYNIKNQQLQSATIILHFLLSCSYTRLLSWFTPNPACALQNNPAEAMIPRHQKPKHATMHALIATPIRAPIANQQSRAHYASPRPVDMYTDIMLLYCRIQRAGQWTKTTRALDYLASELSESFNIPF
jgi:hypothetical protein